MIESRHERRVTKWFEAWYVTYFPEKILTDEQLDDVLEAFKAGVICAYQAHIDGVEDD